MISIDKNRWMRLLYHTFVDHIFSLVDGKCNWSYLNKFCEEMPVFKLSYKKNYTNGKAILIYSF